MKKIVMLCFLAVVAIAGYSQTVDLRRKIDVVGSADMEITPDIIYVGISLKEYYNGNKKAADIDELEKDLQKAVVKAGIPKENLFINNVSAYNYTLLKKKNPNFAASKQYRIKLTDPSKFNEILSALDPKAIESTNIDSYDHSKMAEFRKELKIKALEAAKEKAKYLADAVNDKIGSALEIQELNNDGNNPMPVFANTMVRYKSDDGGEPADIDFKKIKLHYEVKTIFELIK
jgi:uncharacterized protein YggE